MKSPRTHLLAGMNRHSDDFSVETGARVTQSSLGDPVAIEMGASSPTLVLELDTPSQSGMGTPFTIPASTTELEVKFTAGEGEEEGEGDEGGEGVRVGEGGGEGGEGEKVKEGGDEKMDDDGEEVMEETTSTRVETVHVDTVQEGVREGVREGVGVGVREDVGEGVRVGVGVREGVGEGVRVGVGVRVGMREGDGEQTGSIMQSQETLPPNLTFDLPEVPPQPLSYTPSSPLLPTTMETVALEIQDVVADGGEGVDMEGELEEPLQLSTEQPQAGEEENLLNMSSIEVPLSVVGGHPLEPGEHQLEVMEHRPQDIGYDSAITLDTREGGTGIMDDTPSSSAPLSRVGTSPPPGVVHTHLSDLLSPSPSLPPPQPTLYLPSWPHDKGHEVTDEGEEFQTLGGRGGGVGDVGPEAMVLPPPPHTSPYPEEVAGVREGLYTAWIPSPWTQNLLLSRPESLQHHLTCPGLAADIKMVRGS